jgi:hypothetical protein
MTDKEQKITQEELKELLLYEPETGLFWWLVPKQGRNIERPAGTESEYGYRSITIEGYSYSYHRLAFFYMTGEWPPEYVDHKDGNARNNRWDNLRLATAQQNAQNKKRKFNSFTGIKGVVKDFRSDTWHVHMKIDNNVISRGPFYNYQDACKEYDRLAGEGFGEFAKQETPRQQRATFNNKEVHEAIEDFIKNKKLVGGRYI